MVDQIHKRLMDGQVTAILEMYVRKEIDAGDAMGLLDLKRRQFFKWVKKYKENPVGFTIVYHRNGKSRGISEALEENILGELRMEKTLIDDPSVPIRFYNYSFIKDQLKKNHRQDVSVPTIIDRAKKKVITYPSLRKNIMTVRSLQTM